MKKMIGILVMVFIFAFAAASVLAISDDEERDGDKTIFASQNVVDDIKEDLDEQQIRSFFHEEEVILDFEHIIPVYMPLNIEESTTLSESLEFINEYNVPVVDEHGNSNKEF